MGACSRLREGGFSYEFERPVIIGAIRPGMVVTDLLTKPFEGKPAEWEGDSRA